MRNLSHDGVPGVILRSSPNDPRTQEGRRENEERTESLDPDRGIYRGLEIHARYRGHSGRNQADTLNYARADGLQPSARFLTDFFWQIFLLQDEAINIVASGKPCV